MEMKQYAEPVHRWCSFSDSWPPSAVEQILSMSEVDAAEWVWDPLGGAGTTAVVAATKGIRSITSDVDPLAVLVAKIKTDPPSGHVLEQSVWPEARSLRQIFSELAADRPSSRSARARTMRFLIAASLLRVGWHLGEPFDEARVRAEFSLLRGEMLSDRSAGAPSARAHVYQGDFIELVPLVRRLTKGRAVMITSPPFPGSNDNPKLLQLKRAVSLIEGVTGRRKAVSFPAYRRILDSVARAAVQVGCRVVAVELSARRPPVEYGKEYPAQFLAKRLEGIGYSTVLLPFNIDESDPSLLCVGRRSESRWRFPESIAARLMSLP